MNIVWYCTLDSKQLWPQVPRVVWKQCLERLECSSARPDPLHQKARPTLASPIGLRIVPLALCHAPPVRPTSLRRARRPPFKALPGRYRALPRLHRGQHYQQSGMCGQTQIGRTRWTAHERPELALVFPPPRSPRLGPAAQALREGDRGAHHVQRQSEEEGQARRALRAEARCFGRCRVMIVLYILHVAPLLTAHAAPAPA